MKLALWQTIAGVITAAAGGAWLTYFFLPKKDLVKMLLERINKLEDKLENQGNDLLMQAKEIGELRAEVIQCKELHRQKA